MQDGKYREALGKWEAALTLAPDVPVLHEQKAQVLLEIGDAWNALKAATRMSTHCILLNHVRLMYTFAYDVCHRISILCGSVLEI